MYTTIRFRDDTAADIASSRTNAASPIARVSRSRGARVTDLPDKTPRRAAFLSDQPRIARRSIRLTSHHAAFLSDHDYLIHCVPDFIFTPRSEKT